MNEKTDEENGNHPVDIGDNTDTETKNEIAEVQRIADVCVGAGRHEISGSAQCASPR